MTHLKKLASSVTGGDSKDMGKDKEDEDDDDDVPDLVENFDEASKGEGIVQGKQILFIIVLYVHGIIFLNCPLIKMGILNYMYKLI